MIKDTITQAQAMFHTLLDNQRYIRAGHSSAQIFYVIFHFTKITTKVFVSFYILLYDHMPCWPPALISCHSPPCSCLSRYPQLLTVLKLASLTPLQGLVIAFPFFPFPFVVAVVFSSHLFFSSPTAGILYLSTIDILDQMIHYREIFCVL